MTPRGSTAILLLRLAPFAGLHAAETSAVITAPASNWVLPIFTDREGYRTMTLRGSEASTTAARNIQVTNLSIFVFSGDAAAHVDSVLLSPAATFYPKMNRAAGDQSVRLVRDD